MDEYSCAWYMSTVVMSPWMIPLLILAAYGQLALLAFLAAWYFDGR